MVLGAGSGGPVVDVQAEPTPGAGLSGEAPVDSCHVKVSKCKADVYGGPGRGARIYLGPESACDLRFIAFSRFILFTMMGDLSYLKI